jgi:1-acyl-sn-glycerol-3-phosphate acyltransferase
MRPHYQFGWTLTNLFFRHVIGFRVHGRAGIPPAGPLIVASNHISFWDPPMVGSAITRETHFLAKASLFEIPALGWLIKSYNALPIHRGRFDRAGVESALEVLRRGGVLLLFPEGGRRRAGRVEETKLGVGLLSFRSGAPILPARIVGSDRVRASFVRKRRVEIFLGRLLPAVTALPGERPRDAYRRASREVLHAINGLGPGAGSDALNPNQLSMR